MTFHRHPAEDQNQVQLIRAPCYDQARFVSRAGPVIGGFGGSSSHAGMAEGIITSPMPGAITKIAVTEGEKVDAHQPLVVLEAMKMEHVLAAPHPGVIRRVHHAAGDVVAAGEALIEIGEE